MTSNCDGIRETVSELYSLVERVEAGAKIVTDFVYPPIPVREFDWCAWVDGCEEDGPRGWGKTKEQAVTALLEELVSERGLTTADQKAQGKRCGCAGTNDYCVCQNVPDDQTTQERIAALRASSSHLADASPKSSSHEGTSR